MKALIMSLLFFGSGYTQATDPCENTHLEISVSDTSDGINNGTIEIEVEKLTDPVKIYLYGDDRSQNQLNIKTKKIEHLAIGGYYLIVQDGAGCTKSKKVVIR